MKVLILGTGNLLLSDEGVGVHFIRHLEEHYLFPPQVELLDGGTLGMMIMPSVEEADRVYIIDAVNADAPPGAHFRYSKSEIMLKQIPVKLSPHQAGIQEMLLVSEMRGRCPSEIFLLGVVPGSFAPATELSAQVRQTVTVLAAELVRELREIQIRAVPRGLRAKVL
jgi:hydrogenase maturation protease